MPNWNSYSQIKVLGSLVRTSQTEFCGAAFFKYILTVQAHSSWKTLPLFRHILPKLSQFLEQLDVVFKEITILNSFQTLKASNFTYTIPVTILFVFSDRFTHIQVKAMGKSSWFSRRHLLYIPSGSPWKETSGLPLGTELITAMEVLGWRWTGNLGGNKEISLCFSWRMNTFLCFPNVKYNIQHDELQSLLSLSSTSKCKYVLYPNLGETKMKTM